MQIPVSGPDNILLINKPLGWTSFQVVNKVKWLLKQQGLKTKIGHAGTLDPLATGLLILCTGKFTKRISEFQEMQKEYTGTFILGATTPCFDLEKPVDAHYPIDHITEELLQSTSQQFIGDQEQVPPIFSAVKVDGKRAYELAREGSEATIQPKRIRIDTFELTRIQLPEVDFRVTCSKGTYIRSLARDFGKALQSGAHLSALCRTRIGEFNILNALHLEHHEGMKLIHKAD
jgi:tRNA pseudouridine55 synthase